MENALHFVGFKHPNIGVSQEYDRAALYFGYPDFIHQRWDIRAAQEVAPGDVVVIARGCQVHLPFTHDDSAEQ